MKRKVMSVMCIAMASLMCLTGCSIGGYEINLGGNKGEETPPVETPVPEVESVVTGMVYQIDDVINAVDVINTDPAKFPYQTVFLQDGVNPVESITCTEAGEFSIDVIVQYDDSSSWGGTFTYTVEGKDLLAVFPDSVSRKILNENWSVVNVNDTITYSKTGKVDSLGADAEWLTEGDLTESSKVINILTTLKDTSVEFITNNMGEGSFKLFGKEYDWLTSETAGTVIDWSYQLILENLSSVTVDTDYVVYDIYGNTYPVKKNYITNILKDGTVQKFEECYWVKGPNGEILVNNGIIASEAMDTGITIEGLDIPEMPESYEAFRDLVNSAYAGDFVMLTETPVDFAPYFDNIMFGDVTALLPEEVETPSQPTEQTPEAINPPEDVELEVDTSIVTVTWHNDRFPDLYKPFRSEDSHTFSRWDRFLDSTSAYTGTVFDANGERVEIGIKKEPNPDEITIDGWSDGNNQQVVDSSKEAQEFTLLSSAGSYKISNATDKTQSVMTSISTNNKVVCKVFGEVVYVTVANKAAVENLINDCTFNKDLFVKDTKQEIFQYRTDVNDLGAITYYKIRYDDANTEKRNTAGYMATIECDNQYILVLPDAPVPQEVFEHVCMNMISRSE